MKNFPWNPGEILPEFPEKFSLNFQRKPPWIFRAIPPGFKDFRNLPEFPDKYFLELLRNISRYYREKNFSDFRKKNTLFGFPKKNVTGLMQEKSLPDFHKNYQPDFSRNSFLEFLKETLVLFFFAGTSFLDFQIKPSRISEEILLGFWVKSSLDIRRHFRSYFPRSFGEIIS